MIYIGLTSNLIQSRHHKESMIESFTKKYDGKMLVCFENTKLLDLPLAGKSSSRNGKEPAEKG